MMMTTTTPLWSLWSLVILGEHMTGVAGGLNASLKLGVILPYDGRYPWSLQKTNAAVLYAVENVQNRSLLPNYEIQLNYGDSKCSEIHGPLVAIDMHLRQMADVFIGPGCDYAVAPVARYSPHWNIPVITGVALVQAFKEKSTYKQLTRMSSSYVKLGEFVCEMLHRFNWTVVGVIYSAYPNERSARSDCHFTMEPIYSLQMKRFAEKYPGQELWYRFFDVGINAATYNFQPILHEASAKSRSKWSPPKTPSLPVGPLLPTAPNRCLPSCSHVLHGRNFFLRCFLVVLLCYG